MYVFMHSIYPADIRPPPRSVVVRASAQGAGGRGSIPDCVTPKTLAPQKFATWIVSFIRKPNYPYSYDFPLANLILPYKVLTNHKASQFKFHAILLLLGIFRTLPAKWFKILPVAGITVKLSWEAYKAHSPKLLILILCLFPFQVTTVLLPLM